MQERSAPVALDAPMRGVVRATSRDRFWSGLEARIYETWGGVSEIGPIPFYCISMHLSAPIRSTCRTSGLAVTRLQVSGDIDLLPPGSYAEWRDEGETLMFGVTLHKQLVSAAAHSMGIDPDRVALPPHMQLRDPQIEYIARALQVELESEDRFGRVYAESLGVALAAHLLRRYGDRAGTYPTGKVAHRRIRRVLEYVHDNISQELSLHELAKVADLSPSHLKVVFKETTGMPVHQYIIRYRVDQALRLIADRNLPLSAIATLVGFSNQSHMARFMRRITGASPAEIRDKV